MTLAVVTGTRSQANFYHSFLMFTFHLVFLFIFDTLHEESLARQILIAVGVN
jgi:hypothetical protein